MTSKIHRDGEPSDGKPKKKFPKPGVNPVKCTKEQVEQALRESNGLIFMSARKLGICYETMRKYLRRWPELRKSLRSFKELALDRVEDVCYKRAVAGSESLIKFLLLTRGAKRGYFIIRRVENKDVGTPAGKPEEIKVSADKVHKLLEMLRNRPDKRAEIGLKELPHLGEVSDAEVVERSPSADDYSI